MALFLNILNISRYETTEKDVSTNLTAIKLNETY